MLAHHVLALLLTMGPGVLHTNTQQIHDLFFDGRSIWVATEGGLERYSPEDNIREAHYGLSEGLSELEVLEIRGSATALDVRTASHWCRYRSERFVCEPTDEPASRKSLRTDAYAGSTVTARLVIDGQQWIGTSSAGLWRDEDPPVRLTPRAQICSNAITSLEVHRSDVWLASRSGALCRRTRAGFESVAAPGGGIRELLSFRDTLWMASETGLFHSEDGLRWEQVEAPGMTDVIGLASAEDTLWALTPSALFRMDTQHLAVPWAYVLPAGSRSLKKLAAHAGRLWIDTDDRGLVVRGSEGFALFPSIPWLTAPITDLATSDAGTVYLGTSGQGVVTFSDEDPPTVVAGLEETHVHDLRWHDGSLWITTDEGAYQLGGAALQTISELPRTSVRAILPFREEVFVVTDGGVIIYR